jgi:hypothetical protein
VPLPISEHLGGDSSPRAVRAEGLEHNAQTRRRLAPNRLDDLNQERSVPWWPVLRSAAIATNPYYLPDIGKGPPERRTCCGWEKHREGHIAQMGGQDPFDPRGGMRRRSGECPSRLGSESAGKLSSRRRWSRGKRTATSLSDRFDGVDSRAHLTLVATPETTRAAWYRCPRNADEDNGPAGAIDQEELGLCIKIGEDTEPTVAEAAAPVDNEAYEVFWDIPHEIDLVELDILALECVGDLTFVFGPGQTCRQTLEQDITVDDAGIPSRTTSGDVFAICSADFFFGPGALGSV